MELQSLFGRELSKLAMKRTASVSYLSNDGAQELLLKQ